ncbi:MAG: hypothetical protein ACJAQW_001902, partial [Paracoccaceae bacterium]
MELVFRHDFHLRTSNRTRKHGFAAKEILKATLKGYVTDDRASGDRGDGRIGPHGANAGTAGYRER